MYPTDFQLIRQCELPQLTTRALFFRHDSGLQVLSLENNDSENLFALAFATLPADNTGVSHIIEHTVLCGSRRYPLKDPFIDMAKSSQATFINAMTYKNRTVYPIASCQQKDFFNLADVYWDAVFHPLLTRQAFQQEGWHYEVKGKNQELIYNGIVYNEMSGYYQSLDGILDTMVYRHLFPNLPLAYDAGGWPQDICKLTYEQFRAFYTEHYRPDQAKVVFIGNIPTAEKLSFLSRNLAETFTGKTTSYSTSHYPSAETWTAPRTQSVPFVPTAGSEGDSDGALALAWAIADEHNLTRHLQLELLELVLFGNHGAPLHKAIMESGLCSAISNAGFMDECRQTVFLLAVRGCKPENMDRLEALILNCLSNLVQQGLPQALLQGAYRQMLLGYREISKEFCLDIMESVFTAWFAGADPIAFIYPEKELAALAEQITSQPEFVPSIIERYLLLNPHRLRLEMLPDPELLCRQEQSQKQQLATCKDSLSAAQLAELKRQSKKLAEFQKEPNSPQAIATLPRLAIESLPPEPGRLPISEQSLHNGLTVVRGDIFSNGVGYLSLAFDLSALPAHLWPVISVFTALFPRLGCHDLTYDLLGSRMAETTAELSLELLTSSNPQDGTRACTLNFFLYGLEEYFALALDLLHQQLTGKTFQESQRLHELLKLFWSRILAELQDGGQHLACTRAAAGLSWKTSLAEQWSGWLATCQWQKFTKNFRQFKKEQIPLLEELATWLSKQSPALAAYCGGEMAWQASSDFLGQFGQCQLPGDFRPENNTELISWGRREFLSLPSDVFSCVKAVRAPLGNDDRRAGLTIYAHLLSCGYLWNEIRMKSGAYGVHCQYLPHNGTLQLRSTDDPNPRLSLDIFDTLAQTGVEKLWPDDEIRSAIIACSKNHLLPWRPQSLCQNALLQRLTTIDHEWRKKCYLDLLAQNACSVKETVASFWEEFALESNCCVLGPARKARGLNMQRIKL